MTTNQIKPLRPLQTFAANLYKRLALEAAPCKEWTKYRNQKGYGRGQFRGRVWYAHRLAWALAYGEIPRGMCVLHRCDNPPCIEPKHLFLGTYDDNNNDRTAKGRGDYTRPARGEAHGRYTHPEKTPRGEAHSSAKLTAAQVFDIRARYASGGVSQQRLADEYGVTFQLINLIVNRKIWKHV